VPLGLHPEVDAAELQQVEGVEKRPIIVHLAVEFLKIRDAIAVAVDRLASMTNAFDRRPAMAFAISGNLGVQS
jgi:hypothetical protein